MSKTIIHIGANKTGSTTLQRYLFAKSKYIQYIGEDCVGYSDIEVALNSIVTDDDIYYEASKVKDIFSSRFNDENKIWVYSNEDITRSRVPSQCAKRLYELAPDGEILIVLRDQVTAISSWYTNHGAYLRGVPYRYWRQPVGFNEWMEHCLRFLHYSPLDGFFYFQILELYEKLFGKDKIHILFYEDMLNNFDEFVTQLCDVLGIDSEEGFKCLLDGWERKSSSSHTLTEPWKKKIIELYREDNQLLFDKYNYAYNYNKG